jgi:CheY-like chemotaxis protein
MVLTRLLELMGHDVEAVDGGISAISKLHEFTPDLLFSDISMPGMTGYELVKQLRKRDDLKGVYFVAMTGFGQQSDRQRAIESGFDEHMVKPVDIDRLQDLFFRVELESFPT